VHLLPQAHRSSLIFQVWLISGCHCFCCPQVLALSPWVPLHKLPDKAAYDKLVGGLLRVRVGPVRHCMHAT
jgi:hypothetical protein